MLRVLVGSVGVLGLLLSCLVAVGEEKDKAKAEGDKKVHHAVYLKHDADKNSITFKEKEGGKEVEHTYTLGKHVKLIGENGKEAKSADEVKAFWNDLHAKEDILVRIVVHGATSEVTEVRDVAEAKKAPEKK